jgi:hypothetical protein
LSIPTFVPPSSAKVVTVSEADQPEDDRPFYAGPFPRTVRQTNRFRAPSVKNVGKDKNGKVIPHLRSEEIAAIVLHYTGMGASLNFIAAHLNIRPGLIKECYGKELEYAVERTNVEVAGAAFRMATNEEDGAMTKFWLKSRAKWRDGDNAEDRNNSLFNINIHL